jgi:hypothetical protein
MALDISKLQKIKNRGANIIARCPACAENGADNKGEHLFINNEGRFGCVLFPGEEGILHRKRVFELVELKKEVHKTFTVYKAEGKRT